jgi:methylglyoxal/glyoxal reductase
MPVLGLGVYRMADGRETEQAVEWALEAGCRHIDTASMYRNERSVGAALRSPRVERGERPERVVQCPTAARSPIAARRS